MRKINKILDLKQQLPDYRNGSVVSIDICKIRHTSVHYHADAVELVYCLDGQVDIHCNHEFITLKKGQMFTIDFEDVHCLYSSCDNLIVMLHINLKKVHKAFGKSGLCAGIYRRKLQLQTSFPVR